MTIYLLIGLIIGFALGFGVRHFLAMKTAQTAGKKAGERNDEARREAANIIREAEIAAKSEVVNARDAFEKSTAEQRRQITDTMASLAKREETITLREDNIDRKADVIDRKETALENKIKTHEAERAETSARELAANTRKAEAETRIARLAGMTRDEARKELYDQAKAEIQAEMGVFVRRQKELAEETASRDAQGILLGAMQRYSGSHAADTMTKIVPVQGEDAKGKLIGREGRNIRALEAATGVNIIIDDTPESVIVSGFDPIRREIAAMAIDSLLKSGRIQPGRIEEVVAQLQSNMEETVREIGSKAAGDTNAPIVSGKILRQLGYLKFRSSFTQNVLQHSIEVAAISAALAAEIGLD
ncbi:MAG: Rnase Y domain-containing protein, partial [Kiritimatiellaeota bacterium]|nr:Rnase Y domain-containing protein [Kiritimatiellota bacterium]